MTDIVGLIEDNKKLTAIDVMFHYTFMSLLFTYRREMSDQIHASAQALRKVSRTFRWWISLCRWRIIHFSL